MSVKESKIKSEKVEQLTIATLFKFIKSFDGTREKLNSFLTNCDNAISLASEGQKTVLFKYILSQLEGKAEVACSIKVFEDWEQLSSFLKTQFGERKHYAHLLTDLQECRQLSNEPVNQFALRIETCLSKLLTEVTLSNKNDVELIGRTAAMEDLALNSFLLGLKPEISNLVRSKNPNNLNEAINFATSEEKILAFFNKRNPHNNNIAFQRSSSKSQHHTHSRSSAPITSPRPHINQHQVSQNNQSLFCRYCKISGHVLENCRKREYNNSRFKSPQIPQYSQRPRQEFNKPSRVNCVISDDTFYNSQIQESSNTDDAQFHNNHDNLN